MSYISKSVRKLVVLRAGNRCEYCRVPEYLSSFDYHIEHIIGVQHGGGNTQNILAYCCAPCNWKKGPNIATILEIDQPIVPLFNPRKQNWFNHFQVDGGILIPISRVEAATIKLLELNQPKKIEERIEMVKAGFYP